MNTLAGSVIAVPSVLALEMKSGFSLESRRQIVSRYDVTFASDDPYPETPVARGSDPILDGVVRSYGSAFVGYARDELGFKTEWLNHRLQVNGAVYQEGWKDANVKNYAFLQFNHLDDEGNPIPPQALPQRLHSPVQSRPEWL